MQKPNKDLEKIFTSIGFEALDKLCECMRQYTHDSAVRIVYHSPFGVLKIELKPNTVEG